jgi:hypothetical protein
VTKNCLEDFWFLRAGSSALSEEVFLRECSSNGRAFLGGSGYLQKHSWSGTGFEKIHSQMSIPYPISRTEIEKCDRIPKSVDHPSKSCREKHSEDHYRILKKFSERFRKQGATSLSKTSKMSSSPEWSDQLRWL